VVRWEKTTRPFLRSREFLWQEGHTLHATREEAEAETIQQLNVYAKFAEEYLAMPVIKGIKTEKERFAGAEATYTIEALMHDGKALQSGTSHFFGDGFSRAFEVTYTDKNNQPVFPFQTSWGVTTRLIGAIIMTHGDDNGLVLPPMIAPIQTVVVPIATHKEGVVEKANEVYARLNNVCRAKIDITDQSPGWKFAEYEMKGVPLRIELGPRDIENNVCVAVRRDNGEKTVINLDELETKIPELLKAVQQGLYDKALARRESMTYDAHNLDEMTDIAENKPGFIRAMWCGDRECEDKLKEIAGVTSRCIPFEQTTIDGKCVCCGKEAKHMLYWGKAY
jgi:prolyl-tRNA synthetase